MIFAIIDILLTFGILAVLLILLLGTGLFTGFFMYMHLVNSIVFGAFGGCAIWVVPANFFNYQMHPAICIVGGFAIFGITYWLQKTKIGFWIFAIVMSIFYAAIPTYLVYTFKKDMIWTVCVAVGCLIFNITAHIRSRSVRLLSQNPSDSSAI